MSLEKVVRPFQVGDVFNARTLPPSQPSKPVGSTDPSTLFWEGDSNGDYTEGLDPWIYGFKTEDFKEDSSRRETETVKIENKDDPDQFIEVERIKKGVFKSSKTGKELHLSLNWDEGRK